MADIYGQGKKARYIDLRFGDKIFVKFENE